MARKIALPLLVSLVLGAPSFATDPGTPMDCSDLDLAPGLTCTTLTEPGSGGVGSSSFSTVDNDGRVLTRGQGSSSDILEVIGSCGASILTRNALLYHDRVDGSRIPLVSVRSRCLDASTGRFEHVRFHSVYFHAVPGRVFVTATSSCLHPPPVTEPSCPGYPGGGWTARIDGFTPLADLLPPPAPLCSNGLDDDGDGQIDADDGHCKSDADNDESRP